MARKPHETLQEARLRMRRVETDARTAGLQKLLQKAFAAVPNEYAQPLQAAAFDAFENASLEFGDGILAMLPGPVRRKFLDEYFA